MTDQTDATTQPDPQPVDADIGPRFVDTTYVNDAPAPKQDTSKPRPTPGGYFLRFGTVQAAFKEGNKGTGKDGRPYAFPNEVVALPYLTIVSDADGGDEYAGLPINPSCRLTSSRVERRRGVYENYSTLSSALAAVGLEMPVGEAVSADDIIAAAEAMSGLTTLHPVYCSYAAEFKFRPYAKLGDGTSVRFSEKAFRLNPEIKASAAATYKAEGGTWARLGWLIDPDDDQTRSWTLTQPSDNVAQKRVFANFQPTDSGFQPKG